MARARQYLLGMYEKAMPMTLSWEEKLTACKNAGFDWVEISIDETDEKIARLEDREQIEEIDRTKRDWWFNAEEALKMGIATDII